MSKLKVGDYVVVRDTYAWMVTGYGVRVGQVGRVLNQCDPDDFPLVTIHRTGETLCFCKSQLEVIK